MQFGKNEKAEVKVKSEIEGQRVRERKGGRVGEREGGRGGTWQEWPGDGVLEGS